MKTMNIERLYQDRGVLSPNDVVVCHPRNCPQVYMALLWNKPAMSGHGRTNQNIYSNNWCPAEIIFIAEDHAEAKIISSTMEVVGRVYVRKASE